MARQEALTTARELFRRSKRLRQLAAALAAEYDISEADLEAGDTEQPTEPAATTNGSQVSTRAPRVNGARRNVRTGKRVPTSQRRDQLVEFLRKHGPTRSAEIMQQTGLPAGTVYRLLREDVFANDDQHRWRLVEQPSN